MIVRQSRPLLRAVLVSTTMFALFAVIGCAVQGQNFLTDLDMRLAIDLHKWAGPGPHDFLEGFNQIASPRAMAVLVVGLTLVLLVRGHYWLAATCVLAEVPGKILEWRLQAYFQRQRPPLEHRVRQLPNTRPRKRPA